MMRLISFLGTGDYQRTRYRWHESDAAFETPYIALAIARLSGADDTLILATSKAESKHREPLTDAFREAGLAAPRFQRLADGASGGELWDNFAWIVKLLRDTAAPVILDITHGFRSQPFFAGAVVAFVRALGETDRSIRIVYGAFEAHGPDNTTPIWDLTSFVELVDWTQGIRTFLTTGHGGDVARRAESLGRALRRQWVQMGKIGQRPALDEFARALDQFSQALITVRIADLLLSRHDTPSAVRRLWEKVQEAAGMLRTEIPPLSPVLDDIRKMIEPLLLDQDHLAGPEGLRVMTALARLYLSLGRYAEAGIALREGLVSRFCLPAATWPGPDYDKSARKQAERLMTGAGYAARELAGLRNDIEHGGFRKQPLPPQTIRAQLEKFVKEIEQARFPASSECGLRATTWLVTRHPGAVEWARRRGVPVDRSVTHLNIDDVQAGDTVVGTLPVNLAWRVCERGARFLNLSLDVPEHLRGQELSADDLEAYGAKLEEFRVDAVS